MIAILLATLSASLYGSTDFVGGLLSRRAPSWTVTFMGLLGAVVATALFALFEQGSPSRSDFAWAALGGIGGGVAMAFIYRGLAKGRMGVVAPISAVGTTVISVLGGLASGERPSVLVWIGILLAAPAILLVSRDEVARGVDAPPPWAGVTDGLIGSVGAGLMFIAVAQVSASAGWWPLAWLQAVSLLTVVLLALVFDQPWVPRTRAAFFGVLTGPLAAAGGVLFLLATQHGYLAVAGVITSLYPAATVLLAVLVLHERIQPVQLGGFVLCMASVACVALG